MNKTLLDVLTELVNDTTIHPEYGVSNKETLEHILLLLDTKSINILKPLNYKKLYESAAEEDIYLMNCYALLQKECYSELATFDHGIPLKDIHAGYHLADFWLTLSSDLINVMEDPEQDRQYWLH